MIYVKIKAKIIIAVALIAIPLVTGFCIVESIKGFSFTKSSKSSIAYSLNIDNPKTFMDDNYVFDDSCGLKIESVDKNDFACLTY